jgi:CheY-specific phosphatase CheX
MNHSADTIDIMAKIIGESTVEILHRNSNSNVYFAPSLQRIPRISLRPNIGCFVQFEGDYYGLLIINFSREAALEYYKQSMMFMGMPEEELTDDYTSEEVLDSIGELVNQLIGHSRHAVQKRYGLSSQNGQPKGMVIMDSILLSLKGANMNPDQCRRLSFKFADKYPFHIELFFEDTEFISLPTQLP